MNKLQIEKITNYLGNIVVLTDFEDFVDEDEENEERRFEILTDGCANEFTEQEWLDDDRIPWHCLNQDSKDQLINNLSNHVGFYDSMEATEARLEAEEDKNEN